MDFDYQQNKRDMAQFDSIRQQSGVDYGRFRDDRYGKRSYIEVDKV